MFQNSFAKLFFLVAGVVSLGGCDFSSVDSKVTTQDADDISLNSKRKTGFDVTLGFGAPGQSSHVSRLSSKVVIWFQDQRYATLELTRDTTSDDERGDFTVNRHNPSGTQEGFAGVAYASQTGRVVNVDGKKYVDVWSTITFQNNFNASSNFRAPFLTSRSLDAPPPASLRDYEIKERSGMVTSSQMNVTRLASEKGDDPSWSVVCSRSDTGDQRDKLRLCTVREYKERMVLPGQQPNSTFMGLLMCGPPNERRYLTLSMSFVSGGKTTIPPSQDVPPIKLNVSGLHEIEVPGDPDQQLSAPQFFPSEPWVPSNDCEACGASFAYPRYKIVEDPVLQELKKIKGQNDSLGGSLTYPQPKDANNLPSHKLGDDIVAWISDGDETL